MLDAWRWTDAVSSKIGERLEKDTQQDHEYGPGATQMCEGMAQIMSSNAES